MNIRIITGPTRDDFEQSDRMIFANMAAFADWLQDRPRLGFDQIVAGRSEWWAPSSFLFSPRGECPDLDTLSHDMIVCATQKPELLRAFDDYDQIRYEVPTMGWHVMALRLSRPTSWYGARMVESEVAEPLGPRTVKADIFALAVLDMLEEGARVEYRPGQPYFTLEPNLMRRIYLTRNMPAMLQPQAE